MTYEPQNSETAQIPTSLTLQSGPYTTYNGQPYGSIPHFYGYSQTETYTVLDQNGKAITDSGMTANESVTVVSSNPSGIVNTAPGPVDLNAAGQFYDYQSFGFTSPPPPQNGEYVKTKQVISISLAGVSYQVRINCIDAEYNSLTITDVTDNSAALCK
jgi:hypothetical protein